MAETLSIVQQPITEVKKLAVPPIVVTGILFFIFCFVTWLNSILIPYLRGKTVNHGRGRKGDRLKYVAGKVIMVHAYLFI